MRMRFRGVWPMPPCEPCGRRCRVGCWAGGAVLTAWPAAPRGLLGLGAAPVARCVWLGLVALSIASCDRLGLAALLNAHRSIGWALVV